MIIKQKNIQNYLFIEEDYKKSSLLYQKHKSKLEQGSFEFLDDIYKESRKTFYSIVNCVFFFELPELKQHILNSDFDLSYNIKQTVLYCGLTRNVDFCKKALSSKEFDFKSYELTYKMINRFLNFEYAEYLLDVEVPFNFKEEFFLECCREGKQKTVVYFLNNYELSSDIMNKALLEIIKNKRTGTLQGLFKHSKCKFNIDRNMIEYLSNIEHYNVIKMVVEHRDFDKDKYAILLFTNLFNRLKKIPHYTTRDNYINFLQRLIDGGFKKSFPSSIIQSFRHKEFDEMDKFLTSRSKIDNF